MALILKRSLAETHAQSVVLTATAIAAIANELTKGTKLEILYNPGYANPQAYIMWGASINHDKFSQSATKVIQELTEEGKLNIADVEQGKIKFQDKWAERVYHFNRGTSVLSIVSGISMDPHL